MCLVMLFSSSSLSASLVCFFAQLDWPMPPSLCTGVPAAILSFATLLSKSPAGGSNLQPEKGNRLSKGDEAVVSRRARLR